MSKVITIIFVLATMWFIARDANAGVIGRAPNNLGLVGYWSFNDATSTTRSVHVQDFSGNNNHGVMTNMANPATAVSGVANGKLGKALNFDGTNDYVEVSDNSTLRLVGSAGTASAWVIYKTAAGTLWPRVVSKMDNATSPFPGWEIFIDENNSNKFVLVINNSNNANLSNSPVPSDGAWHHIVTVWTGSQIVYYFDGKSDRTITSTLTPNSSTVPLRIGDSSNTARRWNGLIDEVRIYNRALTAAEVQALYNSR